MPSAAHDQGIGLGLLSGLTYGETSVSNHDPHLTGDLENVVTNQGNPYHTESATASTGQCRPQQEAKTLWVEGLQDCGRPDRSAFRTCQLTFLDSHKGLYFSKTSSPSFFFCKLSLCTSLLDTWKPARREWEFTLRPTVKQL